MKRCQDWDPEQPCLLRPSFGTGFLSGTCRCSCHDLVEDVAFRFLSGNQQPRPWALNQFRARHREALSSLFVQSVRLAANAGLVKLGHVAIDGSELKANTSLSKAMSDGRMAHAEQRLRDEIDAYMDACDEIDAAEDEEFGPDRDGQGPPEHLRTREGRLEAIRLHEYRSAHGKMALSGGVGFGHSPADRSLIHVL